jgi:hypothetical protein
MDNPHPSDTPVRTEAEQRAFHEGAMERALRAEAVSGAEIRHLELAGSRIALSFAGGRLLPHFLPALSHLLVQPVKKPDLTIHLWDSESTGVEMTPPPCSRDCFTDRGDIWGMSSPRFKSAFHWIEFSVNLLDLETGQGTYWVKSDAALPYWAKASPLRTFFHWWMERRGGQLLHAAGVGTPEGAVLVTGKGGVGKSTTALACLDAGMGYVADDYLVVSLDPEPAVHSLYCTAKLDPDQVERFPALAPHVTHQGLENDEKAVIQLLPEFGRQVRASLPLRAIATPRFAHRPETSFGPVDSHGLERAASFTTLSQLPHAGPSTQRFIRRLVKEVPGVTLELGTDLALLPEKIQELLAKNPAGIRELGRPARASKVEERPLVSVVIPVYNGAHFLPSAIENILSQGYPALEIIVVDDGSQDEITQVVESLPTDVRFFRRDNEGPAAARNHGIRDASGELIAFLDVDDFWPHENLTILVERMERDSDVDVIHGRAQVVRETASGELEYLGNPAEAFPYYIGAGLYRRGAFRKVGLFDKELRYGEDTDWFNRAREAGLSVERLDEVTLFVRRHDENMTRGRSMAELNTLLLFKKALDRQRQTR